MAKKTYVCENCLKEKTTAEGEKTPQCCGRPMTPKLDGCLKPFVAETERTDSADEPCNDGTGRNN